jgi:hypothetical protein
MTLRRIYVVATRKQWGRTSVDLTQPQHTILTTSNNLLAWLVTVEIIELAS